LQQRKPAEPASSQGGCVVCSGYNGTMKFDNVFELKPARHAGDV
jgi:hypothetical protein